ncbi:MAG: hypothetical protein Q8919_13015, partial [Bacteroidota bacterium]|nr:hypothetical protein [Bacteroidota bacterium]
MTKVGIDTAHIQSGDFKYHIDLLPGSINSNGNENAITFFKRDGSVESILSAERDGDDGGVKQRVLASKLLPDLHFENSTEIKGPSFDDAGAAVYCEADQHLYFTAKAPNDDPNDFDLYSAKIESAGSGYELV